MTADRISDDDAFQAIGPEKKDARSSIFSSITCMEEVTAVSRTESPPGSIAPARPVQFLHTFKLNNNVARLDPCIVRPDQSCLPPLHLLARPDSVRCEKKNLMSDED